MRWAIPFPAGESDMTKTDRRLTARDYRLCAKIGMTQAQTARAMNVTREAVRQYAKRWGIEFRSGKPWLRKNHVNKFQTEGKQDGR